MRMRLMVVPLLLRLQQLPVSPAPTSPPRLPLLLLLLPCLLSLSTPPQPSPLPLLPQLPPLPRPLAPPGVLEQSAAHQRVPPPAMGPSKPIRQPYQLATACLWWHGNPAAPAPPAPPRARHACANVRVLPMRAASPINNAATAAAAAALLAPGRGRQSKRSSGASIKPHPHLPSYSPDAPSPYLLTPTPGVQPPDQRPKPGMGRGGRHGRARATPAALYLRGILMRGCAPVEERALT